MPATRLDMQPALPIGTEPATVLTVLKDTYSSHDMSVMDLIREENSFTIGEADKQEIMRLLDARLEDFCRGTKKELPSCPFLVDEIVVEFGEPIDAILAWVENSGCDIVVMGARPRHDSECADRKHFQEGREAMSKTCACGSASRRCSNMSLGFVPMEGFL